MDNLIEEEWFSLDDIITSDNDETLYCISVDATEKQFLIGDNIAVPTHNTDEGKADDALKGEASMIISSIARLGRAAGVHLVLATQRPDATILPGETKANLGVRINCGRTDSNASSMILGNGEGTRVRATPRGRLYLRIFGDGSHGQGFYAEPEWLDKYLESKGLNPDGSPIGGKKSRLAHIADMSEFDEADLDSREGIDNSSVIENIREEENNDHNFNYDSDNDEEYDNDVIEEREDNWDSLGIGKKKADMSKFERPEDSWDSDMDDILAENE